MVLIIFFCCSGQNEKSLEKEKDVVDLAVQNGLRAKMLNQSEIKKIEPKVEENNIIKKIEESIKLFKSY